MMKKGVPKDKAIFLAQPIAADINTFYNPCLNYSNFFLVGVLFVVLQQIILIGLGYTIADDREHNREAELLELANGHQAAILAGKSNFTCSSVALSPAAISVTVLVKYAVLSAER